MMQRLGVLRRDISVLHFAPEPGLFRSLSKVCRGYTAADYNASAHKNWKPRVNFVDLCNFDGQFRGPYDLIIHNHVLEHLPCKPSSVLNNLIGRLSDNGLMLFTVPIRLNSKTDEDLGELSKSERQLRFGQFDHLRIFGDIDVLQELAGPERNTIEAIDPMQYVAEFELKMHSIPVNLAKFDGNTIFCAK
ncbi:MAG: methyltransferase domain-containing protein [Hyphomicrobiaceae bacterium]